MTNFDSISDSAYVRLPQVLEFLSLSRSTVYRMIENGDFPQSTKLSTRTVAWPMGEIRKWSENRQETAQTVY